MSTRRVLIASLLTLGVLGVLVVDSTLETSAGSFALTLLCTIPALAELLALLREGGSRVFMRTGLTVGVALIVVRGALELTAWPETGRLLAVLGPAAAVGVLLTVAGPRRFGPTVLAVAWVPACLVFLFDLRLLEGPSTGPIPLGVALLIIVATSVKGGDSAAFFVGRTIGRLPMAARISPKKTWEGAVGGFLAGTLVAPLLGLALGVPPVLGLGALTAIGASANVVGQLGDLAESWVKRRAGRKDSGLYLGELGGALDILDALLVAAPVAYFVARLFLAG